MICRNIYCVHWKNFYCNHPYEIMVGEEGKCILYETAELSSKELFEREELRKTEFPLPKIKNRKST